MYKDKEKSTEDYRLVELKGKHGMINLMIPTTPPTQEEIDATYRKLAEVVIDEHKRKRLKELDN